MLFGGLLIAAAGEWKLGGIVAGGFAGGLLVFGGVARGALWALAKIARAGPRGVSVGWRYALASLERRGAASALQITALSIGLMCLLLLAMTRNDLIAGWRQSTPPDAPNQFVIDIQPEQVAPLAQYLAQQGLAGVNMEPMIRGRLTAINGKPVNPDDFADANTKRLVDREFNLSYTSVLPADNRVVAGRWYGASSRAQISIEQGLAKALKVGPGATLSFDVAGQQIEAPISSVRKLDWGSFRVNFFVVMPPAALRDFPVAFITSFHLPAGRQGLIDGLSRQFPNLTVIDIGAILAQLQHVLEQVIGAVQFLFLFTLGGGLLVLYAALAGSRDERIRESALLRALGASHAQVRAVQSAEFVVVGALAGLLAAGGAQAIGSLLATRVFDFTLTINPWLPLVGVAAGMACAAGGGWLGLRKVLRQPVLQSLRDA
jgi:putative ABC transport system permease protein